MNSRTNEEHRCCVYISYYFHNNKTITHTKNKVKVLKENPWTLIFNVAETESYLFTVFLLAHSLFPN